jgi:hypothetical protein
MKSRLVVVFLFAMALAGCAAGPNYQRPPVKTPENFRAPDPLPAPQAASLADLKWWEVFKDDKLQDLIRAALAANYDLRDAVARVEGARASLGVTRSNQLPQVGASGDINFTRLSREGATPLPATFLSSQNRNWGEAMLNLLSFEVDIWGRLRRATEAARANLLSAEDYRKGRGGHAGERCRHRLPPFARTGLRVGDFEGHARHPPGLVETHPRPPDRRRCHAPRSAPGPATGGHGRANHPGDSTANRADGESNYLLLGQSPGESSAARISCRRNCRRRCPPDCLPRCSNGGRTSWPPSRTWWLPTPTSASPRRRISREISLSGFLGGQSTELLNLFSGSRDVWNFVPQISQPIFTAGRLKSNVKLAQAERDDALIQYEKTIQTAFTEVSNALIAHQRVRESRLRQEALVRTLQDRTRLAYLRYRGGVDTELNALDADRDLFQAQLALAEIRLDELLSVVQLYKALGGGWS